MVPDRVSAMGYGEYRPVAGNDTQEGRSMNRRVNIVVLNWDEKYKEPAANPEYISRSVEKYSDSDFGQETIAEAASQ